MADQQLHRLSPEEIALVQAYRRSTPFYRKAILGFAAVASEKSAPPQNVIARHGDWRRDAAYCAFKYELTAQAKDGRFVGRRARGNGGRKRPGGTTPSA